MTNEKTLPMLLIERARNSGNQVALRQKKYGIWNEITWSEYFDNVQKLSIAFEKELGFQKGDKLAIIGDNRPQWLYAQLAAQSLGGIAVGINEESFGEVLSYYINHCDAKIVIAEDQEQVDKLLEIEESIPNIEHIIFYNENGMRRYKNEKLIDMAELLEKGQKLLESESDFLRNKAEQVLGSDVAIISYSSGSTGKPKGVMLTHNNLIQTVQNISEVDPIEEKDDYVSFLSLSWIGEQVMSITANLYCGMKVNFPEEPTTVLTDLREIGPHTLIAPPRTYENIISRFLLRMDGASKFKRKLYNYYKKHGEKVAKAKIENKPVSFGTRLVNFFGEWLMFSAIRDHLGLARIKRAYTFGSTLSEEAITFFRTIGVNLKQAYGTTEVCGIAFMHRDNDVKLNSVGVPLPNVDVKVSDDNEIFIKSPGAFAGYYKEENEIASSQGEWISTGDVGEVDANGHLYVTDQINSIITLPNGEQVSPSKIENILKGSPYIKEAIVYGDQKPYLVSMINIDMDSVGRWAEKNQIVYTTYTDLSMKEEVVSLIEKEVAEIMKTLPEHLRVKKSVILHKELDADAEELTRMQRIRRGYIQEKYQHILEGLYSSDSQIRTKAIDEIEETDLTIITLDGKQEVA